MKNNNVIKRFGPALVIALCLSAALPVQASPSADDSWTVGTGGDALTSLTEDTSGVNQSYCEDGGSGTISPCPNLTIGSNTVTYVMHSPTYGHNGQAYFYLPFSETNMSVIDHFEVSLTADDTGPALFLYAVDSRDDSSCTIVSSIQYNGFSTSGDDPCGTAEFDEISVGAGAHADGDTSTITVTVTGHSTSTSSEGGGNFGGDALYKPISTPDIWTVSEEHGSVFTKEDASVHSIGNGTISEITPVSGMFKVTVIPPFAESEADYFVYYNLQGVNGVVGDEIEAGCVLGLVTDSLTDPVLGTVGLFSLDAPEDVLEDWPEYPDAPDDTPCNVDQSLTEHCINVNPNFADLGKFWNAVNATAGPDGISMPSNSSISQTMTLNPASTYVVTLYATAPYVPAETSLKITVGDMDMTVTIPKSTIGEFFRVETQTFSPGTEDFDPDRYKLTITNPLAPANVVIPPIKVRFACIGTDAPVDAPGACYWSDPDLRTDEWTGTGATTYDSPQDLAGLSGRYVVPGGEMIFRDVSISAFLDADTDYLLLTKSKAGAGTPLTPPYGRWHAYIQDPDTEDVLVDIGEWDPLPVIVTPRVMPFTLTEGTSVTGDLVIENTTDDIDDPGWSQEIYQICLQVEGGVWPGYDNSDTSVLFNTDCTLCAMPGDLGEITLENLMGWVVQWLAFGWCYLGYILKCLILGLLNNVWQTILSFMAGVALFGKWVGMVVSAVAIWARDGIRFAFNNLRASLMPIANAILGWLLSLPIIQFALDAFGIAAIWLDGLFRIINDVIALLLLGLQFIGALLNLIAEIWQAFIASLSAPPAGNFPFPDCTDSGSAMYDACIPLDVVNWLVPKFPALVLLINLAAFSVFWRQFRSLVRAVREDIFSTS